MQGKGRKPGLAGKGIGTWVLVVCLGALTVSWLVAWSRIEAKEEQEALGWPITTGRSMGCCATSYAGDGEVWVGISYEYQVDGRHLKGSTWLGPYSAAEVKAWEQAYPRDSALQVYYDPDDPHRSVVWPEEAGNRDVTFWRAVLALALAFAFFRVLLR